MEPQANHNQIQCNGKHMAIDIQNITIIGNKSERGLK